MDSRPTTPQQITLETYRPDIAFKLKELNCPRFRHTQVLSHLFHDPAAPFSEASSLPTDLRTQLDVLGSTMFHVKRREDDDEGTTKLLLESRDGARIETVVMRSPERISVCVSTQVGCPLRCVFCATGAMGFTRNLTAAEVVDQVRIADALIAAEQAHFSPNDPESSSVRTMSPRWRLEPGRLGAGENDAPEAGRREQGEDEPEAGGFAPGGPTAGEITAGEITAHSHPATALAAGARGAGETGADLSALKSQGAARNPRASRARRRISHVVFMGMGEPLLNIDATLAALFVLKSPHAFDLRQRSIAVSTVGVPEGIRRLAREEPQVNLALSLHAATDELRSKLIPFNRRVPLDEVMRATDDHFRITHRKLLVEYLILPDVNDSESDADALARLLARRMSVVNLIPWNPTDTISPRSRSRSKSHRGRRRKETGGRNRGNMDVRDDNSIQAESIERALQFRRYLERRNVACVVRRSRGLVIRAACGQLATARPGKRKPPSPVRNESE
jgi:23S rRNA (adenine2503-C2)-methyltransferase